MDKRISLKVNFLWALIGNVISQFCMWLLLVLLTKRGTVEMVGSFGIAQAVGLPISMLLSLKLQLAQVTDAKDEFDFGHYYALRIVTSALAALITAIVGFSIYEFDSAVIITALGLGYSIMTLREVFLAVLQKYERMDLIAASRIFQGLFSLLLFGCFFWFTKNIVFAILGLIIARTIVLLSYDIPFSRKLLHKNNYSKSMVPNWHLNIIRKLTTTTAPLGIVALLGTLFTSLPRLFLDKLYGRKDVGYFVAMSSLLVAGTLIVAALTQAVSPRLAKYYAENIKAYKALLLKLVVVAIGLGASGILVAVFAGKLILTIIFRPEYAEHNNVLIILAVAGLLLMLFSFMNVGLTAARKFAIQVPIYAACAIACCISAICFIPRFGMKGAAFSLIVCYVIGIASCFYYIKKAIGIKQTETLLEV